MPKGIGYRGLKKASLLKQRELMGKDETSEAVKISKKQAEQKSFRKGLKNNDKLKKDIFKRGLKKGDLRQRQKK